MKRFLFALTGVFSLSFLLTTLNIRTAEAMTHEEFTEKASDLIEQKIKPDAFIKIADNAIKKHAVEDAVYLGYAYATRGHAFWQKNDMKRAQADAEKALSINPEGTMAHFVLADVYASRGSLEEAAGQADIIAEKTEEAADKKHFQQIADDYRLKASAIAPVTLWKAFDDNEVAAEDAYKDKKIVVKGKISAIIINLTGHPQIEFSVDKNGLNRVMTEFSNDARLKIGQLKKGQEVFIVGQCTGMVTKNVFLKDGRIIE